MMLSGAALYSVEWRITNRKQIGKELEEAVSPAFARKD
jgi:hypothetical protein